MKKNDSCTSFDGLSCCFDKTNNSRIPSQRLFSGKNKKNNIICLYCHDKYFKDITILHMKEIKPNFLLVFIIAQVA